VTTPTATTPGATTPGATPPAGTPAATDNTYTGKIPGQPAGTTIEYYIRATGTKAGAAVTQALPAAGETGALTFTVGAAASSNGVGLKVPQTDGPLIGYSLRSIETTQQIKRTFTLNKAEAATFHYHPGGALSANHIGPAFDASKQVTRVALGQGPFKLIEIKMQAGFDFDKYAVKTATVRIQYGKKADGTFMQVLAIPLSKDKPSAKTQFFADDAGTQTYTYWVEFTYDPEHVIGTVPGQVLSSAKFENVDARSITVDLKVHSPLIPVQVAPGVLSLTNGLIKQVQVRVAPTPTSEGRVVVLDAANPAGDRVFVVPANPASRVYHLQEKFFFQDGSTTVEKPNQTDPQVIVNEPTDLVFKMIPQFVDPTGLVKEVLVDAVYKHNAGAEERSTLHLTSAQPHAEFAVLLAGTDPKEWDASFRFVMNSGDPLESGSQHIKLTEPLVTLKKAGFKVITVSLLDETLFTSAADLQGVRVTLGANLNDPAQPVATLMLRANRTSGSVIVPGVLPDAAVSVAVDALRKNQPPQRTTTTLAPAEKELYVTV